MNLKIKVSAGLKAGVGPIDIVKDLCQEIEHKLFRVILYDDDRRVEIEFEARNPWECLVIRFGAWAEVLNILEHRSGVQNLLDHATIRKKCTKCFLHERKTMPAEMGY